MFRHVSAEHIERMLLAHQDRVRGAPAAEEIVVLAGKEPKPSGGQNVVTAVSAPGPHYPGGVVVAEKTGEIPAVREPCPRPALHDKRVGIAALHTQTRTAREIVLEHGGDFMFTVMANQPNLKALVQAHVPDPGALFLIR